MAKRNEVTLSRSRLAAERENRDVTFIVRVGERVRVRLDSKRTGWVTVSGIYRDSLGWIVDRGDDQPPVHFETSFRNVLYTENEA